MKVLINKFNPGNVILVTELPTFIHDVCKYIFLICNANRMISSVINTLLIIGGNDCITVTDNCIDKINIRSMSAFM